MMEEGELLGSGKLKIFFSYAPGTGKTRTMLTAAGEEQKRGVDVVVGYLEKYCDAEPPEDGLEYLRPGRSDTRERHIRSLTWMPPWNGSRSLYWSTRWRTQTGKAAVT